jgi:undecaprenyl-diphosphatase
VAAAASAVAGVTAVAVSAVSAREGVPQWETDGFRTVRATPPALTAALFLPMQLGAAAAPPIVGVVAARLGLRRPAALGLAVTGLAAWWAGKGVKRLVGRGRPLLLIPGATVAVGGSRDGLGFVSGHAAVSAATATVLMPELPARWRWLPRVVAVLIGVARVQNGSHLPLDVVGGAGLGLALGGAWRLLVGEKD